MSSFVYGLLDRVSTFLSVHTLRYRLTLPEIEQGILPDFLVRRGIRSLCRVRLGEIDYGSLEKNHAEKLKWIEGVKSRSTIADVPEKANEQHYEVRFEF
jgi:hypothetical protein